MSAVELAFGRIDQDGHVYVNDNGVERMLGSQPTMTAEESLAFYTKRYDDLAASVRLLEQRFKAKADPKSINKSALKLKEDLTAPIALGDIQSLRIKVEAVLAGLTDALAASEAERKVAVELALQERESLVVKAEAISGSDPMRTNFKNATAQMTELFEKWQAAQKSSIKLPKAKADELWQRFSKARTSFESKKRTYFATQDQLVKASKNAKLDLVTKAEALVSKGAEATNDYKALLQLWKALPKVKSKADDSLWSRFKAAGDAIYAAKAEKSAADDIAFAENLKVKLELLTEAEKIDPSKNLEAAKTAMKSIQSRWEKAGKVPRDSIKSTEERLKAVESKIRAVEQELWRKSDPATIDRTNSVKTQLEDAIAKLESELASAEKAGDAKKISDTKEAIETKKAWLAVVANS